MARNSPKGANITELAGKRERRAGYGEPPLGSVEGTAESLKVVASSSCADWKMGDCSSYMGPKCPGVEEFPNHSEDYWKW